MLVLTNGYNIFGERGVKKGAVLRGMTASLLIYISFLIGRQSLDAAAESVAARGDAKYDISTRATDLFSFLGNIFVTVFG